MLPAKRSLVRSKLLVPGAAGLLHRPRVCEVVERGLEAKLTLVSAPAGYGKTSALIDFAGRSPVPVCWYTADERDRDLGTFAAYLIAAIGERFPGFGERSQDVLDSLAGDLLRDPTAIIGELTNEILDIDSSFVLVLDNYESVEGIFGLRSFIHRLLEVLPPNCHLMIGSRILPDVPVTRLVAKRQLVGLTAPDLCFTAGEIRDLLRLSQVEVSEQQAQVLATSSEGWITSVLLLADLLQDGGSLPPLSEGRMTHETYSYLAREVLGRQSPDVQHFLYTSAVLREMSVRLCREALHIRNPRVFLEEVERRNLFITRFGTGRSAIYRYHTLFRDFLHEQFYHHDRASHADLHQCAARWFEERNNVEEAVYHYLAAGVYDEATALMDRVAMERFTRGHVETLLHWAAELPEELRSQAPRLSYYQSVVLCDRNEYEEARRALDYAEAGYIARGDKVRLGSVHILRGTLHLGEGAYEEAIHQAQMALDMLAPDAVATRAEAERVIGRAYVGLGRLVEGTVKLERALELYRQAGSLYDVSNVLQDLVSTLVKCGRFDEATSHLNQALSLCRRLGAPGPLANILNSLACAHQLRVEYQEALTFFQEGLAMARRSGDQLVQAVILVGMAELYRDVGIYARAEPLFRAGRQLLGEDEPDLVLYTLAAQADMYRWQGELTHALALIQQGQALADEKGLDFGLRGLLAVSEGIARAEQGKDEAGRRLLAQAIRFLEERQARREVARARFLLAKAHLLAGDEPQAIAELRAALNLADEIAIDHFAVIEGQHAMQLLELGRARGVRSCAGVAEKIHKLHLFRQQQMESDVQEEGPGRLEVYAFGEGRVVSDGRTITTSEWHGAMTKELFFYILLHGPLERDAIGLVFWPDLSSKKMTDSFHTAMYRARRALGSDVIVVEEGQYRIGDVDYWFDVEEFEMLTERARLLPPCDWQVEHLWRRAVDLYRGDFLPEVDRLWSVPRREALRETYLEALIGIGESCAARGEFEGAVEWYRRALEMDELREDIHRHIMRCYVAAGRRSEALLQYEACRRILRQELDLEPSFETQKLYEQISSNSPSQRPR